MKDFSAKFDVKINWLRCISIISSYLIIVLFFAKPLASLDAKETEQFSGNLKNYNVKLQILNPKKEGNKKLVAQFDTAIADNNDKRRIGLMNLDSLPQNQAMLFVFDRSKLIAMWMKNTKIPLDMLFIDENDIIVNLETETKPYSLEIIPSKKPVIKVLEINAGLSKKLGIKIGQEVKY